MTISFQPVWRYDYTTRRYEYLSEEARRRAYLEQRSAGGSGPVGWHESEFPSGDAMSWSPGDPEV